MDKNIQKGLLPNGLRDSLSPEAFQEREIVSSMMKVFDEYGYDSVRPPLLEFEESLLKGPGGALGDQMFRLMDPISHKMMAIRADITPQISRIASTRLKGSARPLRLSYSGPVLTVSGSELRPDREITQVGIELIGSKSLKADAEIITVTAAALKLVGLEEISFDLSLPQLVPQICESLKFEPAIISDIREILNRKDEGSINSLEYLDNESKKMLTGLLRASGYAEIAIQEIGKLSLPPEVNSIILELEKLIENIRNISPDLNLTLDPVEFRGAKYHTGVSFTIFFEKFSLRIGTWGPLSTIWRNCNWFNFIC